MDVRGPKPTPALLTLLHETRADRIKEQELVPSPEWPEARIFWTR
jgi:hypothetical protein